MINFDNRICIVTGGALGIGRKVVEQLHSLGATVVIADLAVEAAERTAAEISQGDGTVVARRFRLGVEADAQSLAEYCRDQYGRVDVLVNNAAVRGKGVVTEATVEDWERILGANVMGIGLACKHIIPLMTSGDGSIVNVSSANAIGGRTKMALYDASKAAVIAMSRDMACDHGGQGIRVNSVLPGPTLTDFHHQLAAKQGKVLDAEHETTPHEGGPGLLRRRGKPDEIAAGIVFLASTAASYVTGTTLLVDGGLTAESDGRPPSAR